MNELLLNLVMLVAILGISAFITHWFANTMYIRCGVCGTLNARRRSKCRSCDTEFGQA